MNNKRFASINLPAQKPVFFIATCGNPRKNYFDEIKRIAKKKMKDDIRLRMFESAEDFVWMEE
jgi:hypothetical protein